MFCMLLALYLVGLSWMRVIYLLPWLQVRNNLLEPVIQVLVRNGPRYNLLNSAVLEMVEFVRKENVRYIIQHLVEQFWQQLESCDYVGTFAALKLKHEQNQVGCSTRACLQKAGPLKERKAPSRQLTAAVPDTSADRAGGSGRVWGGRRLPNGVHSGGAAGAGAVAAAQGRARPRQRCPLCRAACPLPDTGTLCCTLHHAL